MGRQWHEGPRPLLCWIPALFFCQALSAAPPTEEADACELVAAAALDRLPIQYRSIFEPHRAAILSCAAGQAGGRFPNSPVLMRKQSHYVMLDAAAADASPPARLKAIRAFPRGKAEADRHMTVHNHREGGDLPWTLMEQCDALAGAIRARNEPETARLAGVVTHLAVDVCCPFSTTTSPRGPASGQFVLPSATLAKWAACADARGRTWDGLIRRHRATLADALALGSSTCDEVGQLEPTLFAALTEAAVSLDGLIELDNRLIRRWDVRDGETMIVVAEAFLAELDRDALPLVTRRLDRAACLAAGLLMRAAGEATGLPAPSALAGTLSNNAGDGRGNTVATSPATERPAEPAGRKPVDAASSARPNALKAAFVGSRNATKFHVPTCRWAQNIKEDNLVHFSTAAEALAAGREPCAQCKPHD